ncbi:MAG: RNA polymerase factor sigma-54 [Lentisphaeria bacterium]|nr:RNA polymerase factor sigma-54 [Lentisphaeria bacterium]
MTEINQQQKIEQKLSLSAKQLQSLQLLYVPIFELEQSINNAVETNVVLEYEEFSDNTPQVENKENNFSDNDNNMESYSENFSDDYNDNYNESDNYDNAEKQKKRDNFLANITEEVSLQQQLLNELSYLELSAKDFEIAEEIISNIGDSGIIETTLADIAMVCNVELEDIERILQLIQSITIPGVGARDLKECLKLQLIAANRNDEQLFELIDNHLQDIADNNLNFIAESMKISLDELNVLLEQIRRLNPHPGAMNHENKSNFIIPEAEIIYDEELDDYRLAINDYYIPKIRIAERYTNMLNDKFLSANDRDYLKQKITEAQNFTASLALREKTITKIAELIMNEQHDFWRNGAASLKPMTMAQAAERLNIHEATVSRGCSGKYLLTPQGLLEFKYFFSHGIQNSDGENFSVTSIKEKIRRFIDSENSDKPLSDEKISAMLKSEGIDISRRTVAKYRDAMEIAPAHKRKLIL